MRVVFVDSLYRIATIREGDQHQRAAFDAMIALKGAHFVTTEEVLVEFFSGLCRSTQQVRQAGLEMVRKLLQQSDVTVVQQSHESFLAGLNFYERRLDQGYSLVDCISMSTMRRRRIRDVLSSDRHFAREGFRPLIRV